MRAFLSHSNKDKKFVRRLHESLLWIGVDTFFDERNIKVGDNIPKTIEKGLLESTCLIYVLSSNSINSEWVNEELSMAKIRSKLVDGFKVLPVLIEELELPIGISHIKYANFVGWELSERYYLGLDELFDGLGVKKKIGESGEINLILRNYDLFINLELAAYRYSEAVEGLVDGFFEGLPNSGIESINKGVFVRYSSFGLSTYLTDLGSILDNFPEDKFVELRTTVSECANYEYSTIYGHEFADEIYKQRTLFRKLAQLISQMLREATKQMITTLDLSNVVKSSTE